MSLFKKSKATIIPELENPKDKKLDKVMEYLDNELQDDPKDMEFPLPKPENIYLKINNNNYLEPIDKVYITDIYYKISKFRDENTNNFDIVLKTVKEIFDKMSDTYKNLFDYSLEMSKNLEVTKEHIEKCYKVLLSKKNATTLDFDAESLESLGRMVSYSYSKIYKYKIKDMTKLEEAINKVLTQKINIYNDFIKYCSSKHLDPNKEKITEYYKERRKEYILLPEIIFLINHFRTITTVNIELDKIYSDNLTEIDFKFLKLAVLNLHWILTSLVNVKFNLIFREIQFSLFKRYKEKASETCNKINDVIKPKDLIFKDPNCLKKKWNFSGNLKLCNLEVQDDKEIEISQSKTLGIKGKKNVFTKTFQKTFQTIADIFSSNKQQSETRLDIVKKYSSILELIIICFFSLNEADKGINFELIMNDTLNGEFFLLLSEIYKFDWMSSENTSEFHIFDLLLYNKVISNIDKFNVEINCLDKIAFGKIINFLYFTKSLTKLNMSLFSSDHMYVPEFIFKIYSEIFTDNPAIYLKRNFGTKNYLFCDIKDMEGKILEQLYPDFVLLLGTLFEIINNNKKLTELGFNIDAPKNIENKSDYMNAIYKFILNCFFYVSKNNINKFCILSSSTQFNSIIEPEIDDVIESINFENNNLEDLTIQLNFVELQSVRCFILPKLKILNIGNLEIKTLEYLCNVICSYQFNQNSCLESLSIGLSNSLYDLNSDLKKLIGKICRIKIKLLEKLTLLTNLDLSNKKDYNQLLYLLNYNWIPKYVITFNRKGKEYNSDENVVNMKYIIPKSLSKNLVEKRDLNKISDIKDSLEFYYWCLKYIFDVKKKNNFIIKKDTNKKIVEKLTKKEGTKKIIFDIIKYINITKTPDLTHIYAPKI
jgi:outer membrane lipoprotein-sorting protein